MRRLSTLISGALPLALLAVLAPATVASAEITSFTDPGHDVHGPDTNLDIGRVVVQHSTRTVRVRLFPAKGVKNASTGSDGITDVWFDTDSSRPGPEWVAYVSYGGERPVVSVYPAFQDARGFHTSGDLRHPVCSLHTASYNRHDQTSQSTVPRRCIGNPASLRINVTVTDESYRYPNEFAPGQRQFGPWTKTG